MHMKLRCGWVRAPKEAADEKEEEAQLVDDVRWAQGEQVAGGANRDGWRARAGEVRQVRARAEGGVGSHAARARERLGTGHGAQ